MGQPATPQGPAPAYDDVFRDHPVNRFPPVGSTSAYATVPQDDVELQAHTHNDDDETANTSQPETLAQTIAGVFRPKPHKHCEQCDVQLAARERRENQKHCCSMVASTFMVGFVCAMIFGITAMSIWAKVQKHRDD